MNEVRNFYSDETMEAAARRELDAALNDFANVAPSIDFEQAEAALHLEERLQLLNEIGLALSAVRDIKQLVSLILSKARELTGADAGSLYLVNTSGTFNTADDTLYFCDAQNDSIHVETTRTFPVSSSSLAGYVALTGKTLCFEDVYDLPKDAPYKFNPSFDLEFKYHTKSVLVVPMRNHKGGILGVLQLINRKRHRDVKLRQCGIENSRFVASIRDLFKSLVTASASAIEDRDPTTSGHSWRVTKMTVALAEAAHAATDGPFRDVRFSALELEALRYAGLLHDFGKIGVPEHLLTKSHKLQPADFEKVKGRLFSLRQERRAHYANEMAQALRAQIGQGGKGEIAEAQCVELEKQLRAELEDYDELVKMLVRANDPAVTFLPDDEFARQQELVARLAQMTYEDEAGQRKPILDEKEVVALSIRKGSLTLDEFEKIKNHAQLSYEFLNKIHWTEEYARIPLIAWGHHEKLNGKGYPRGVTAPNIPLETRLMTVADIFEALTATRPYKNPMPTDRALDILRKEAASGELDSDVVDLFINHKIYEVLDEAD